MAEQRDNRQTLWRVRQQNQTTLPELIRATEAKIFASAGTNVEHQAEESEAKMGHAFS